MAQLNTPDSINGEKTQLVPGAHGVSVFQGATKGDVAEPAQVSGLAQLGAALSKFADTTLVTATAYYSDINRRNQMAEGQAAAEKVARDKTVNTINDAVKQGKIPEGLSPTSIFAANTNFLKLRAEQSAMNFREAYYAADNSAVRESKDPGAFKAWADEWRLKNDHSVLYGQDNNPSYHPLELAKSDYSSTLNNAMRGVEHEHIAYRTAEQEKYAHETAGNLAATVLDKEWSSGIHLIPKEQRNMEDMAAKLVAPYYDPDSGQVTHGGMSGSLASKDLTDTIVTKAIAEGDPSILELADHIKTPGGVLAGTKYSRKTFEEARLHIASQKYLNDERQDQEAKRNAQGTLAERAVAYRDAVENTRHTEAVKKFVDVKTNQALDFADLSHMSPKQLQTQAEHLQELQAVDPEAALKVRTLILTAKEHYQTAENKDKFPLNEMDMWNALLRAPGTVATNRKIDQGLRDHWYSGEEWRRLRAESDKKGQEKLKYAHILDDEMYKNLERNVGRAVYKDPEKPLGAEAIAAGKAQFEFRSRAIAFINANPTANAVDVATAMEPNLETIATRYNASAKELVDAERAMNKGRQAVIDNAIEASKPEVKKKVAEQVKKAEVQTAEIKAKDQGKAEPVKPFSTANESAFKLWKEKYAKNSKATDAELRDLFKSGKKP